MWHISTFRIHRWFQQWEIKIHSEKVQRGQQKEQIGENLAAEFIPLEHPLKKGKKTVVKTRKTACACIKDLEEKILACLEQNSK